jgi:hypothetical protein
VLRLKITLYNYYQFVRDTIYLINNYYLREEAYNLLLIAIILNDYDYVIKLYENITSLVGMLFDHHNQ